LEEADSDPLIPSLTRARVAHAKTPHALVLDELGKHEAVP
jgi:hypothetical protein